MEEKVEQQCQETHLNKSQNLIFKAHSFGVRQKEGEIGEEYKIDKKLGEGSYGASPEKKDEYVSEIEILKELDHPNILKIYEFYEDASSFHIITDYCECGDLFDQIQEGEFEETDAAMVMAQILRALIYAHEKGIVHRDLKSENIMVDYVDEDKIQIKVIDWGGSGIMKFKNFLKRYIGTAYFMAPEIIKEELYNEKVDIWSCGVILYEMLSQNMPFYGDNSQELTRKIMNNEFFHIVTKDDYEKSDAERKKYYISHVQDKQIEQSIMKGKFEFPEDMFMGVGNLAKDLIKKMLVIDPKKRLSAKQCLEHPWFKEQQEARNKKNEIPQKKIKNSLLKLINFNPKLKFQHVIFSYFQTQLISKEENNKLSDIFTKLDTDGNGVLSRQELIDGYQIYLSDDKDEKLSQQEIEKLVDQIIQHVDSDFSGSIDYSEFKTANIKMQTMKSFKNLQHAFDVFDKDKNGKISLQELKEILGGELSQQAQSEEEQNELWNSLIQDIDKNKDNEIDFEEFITMMNNMVELSYSQTISQDQK